ncbi:MAG: cytochrome c3 family protein [Deltaproteobacteria bacterium]|nr:cytochrome c3 family protein [Deltaproteobacteria bacterium]
MKKRQFVWFLVGLFVVVTGSILQGQPEKIVLDHDKAFKKRQRPPVVFPHEAHMADLSCTDCHHRYEKGRNVLDESELEEGNADILCSHCHDRRASVGLREAFHRQCIGCHRQTHTEGGRTGPRLCGECHRRG